ncbi:NAD(P)-binding protein [Aureobasidium pullulans]|uniref:NAD(P)-binding protein n=1 Tax=Aureobasidium pullulans TaxID=5580 RepID=A0A4S9XBJ6_AURPU|nr:NAD(P)-binding protein [Aureobasidium pullulans]THW09765.1 NAD(P)-binding protein [Aureobasidium pullulans]THW16690.1 NAD(P)-binding protein [Aureobasidium pullulans]THX18951.1 NAD(P)-binding protein [Aureobasidium pullulans]THY96054.1 NAD(P)-binding protein [Aureobasidium pullulans]
MVLNFGIIGTNWITESFIQCAQASEQWKLAAVYSRSEESARTFADKFSVKTVYTSIESLVQDSNLDAVYVASPNSLHYSQAKTILQAKKHVILEKPATSTLAELEDLFKIAKENNVFLIEAYRHIQEVNYKLLRRILFDEKKLGTIFGASLNFSMYSSRYNNVLAGETPNIFSLEMSGGSLVDMGVYPVMFAIALFGKPKSQTYAPVICHTGADAGGFIILQYEKFGVQIQQSKCFTSFAPTEIYGENGTISLNSVTDIASVKLWDRKTKQTEELAEKKMDLNLQEEATEFARIINNKDTDAAAKLEQLSYDIVSVTSDLRRQNGILYPADKA